MEGTAEAACSCPELSAPPSPGSPQEPRRGTWCEGAAEEGARALLRAWAALAPEPEEQEAPPRARRSLSLPAGGGCCHKCKKRVQFADSLGLRLASVKHYSAAEEPQVPPAVLSRLLEEARGPPGIPPPPMPLLLPDFPEPAGGAALDERLLREKVCLERVRGAGLGEARLEVLARGPGEASVRYTFNDWLSFVDAQPEGPDEEQGGARRLRFTLAAPPSCLQPGACLHFAVCLREPGGAESWDNNRGCNYTLRCRSPGDPQEPD